MARNHIFPVCTSKLHAVDITGSIDETSPYAVSSVSNYYPFTSSSGLKGAITVLDAGSKVSSISWALEGAGEFLFDGTISAPSPTSFNWTGAGDDLEIACFLFPRVILQSASAQKFAKASQSDPEPLKNTAPGEVFCVGVKRPSDPFTVNLGMLTTEVFLTDTFGGTEYPFGKDNSGFRPNYVAESPNNSWATVMWTGTRFVLLGSNNWV